jgi:hypothetical protein
MYSENETFLVLGLLVVLLLAGEAGYRYGRKSRARTDDLSRSQAVTIQAAILGLLGLLLGFTFAMAVARFDSRKQLVVAEANAIGTAYLRARLLPEPERTEVVKLLRQYIDARLETTRLGPDLPSAKELEVRVAGLQELLWSQAIAATERDRRAVSTGLFVQSLNEVIDIAGKRDAALENHIPDSVLVLLFLVTTLCVAVVGYGCGLGSGRTLFAMLALSGLITVVVLIIIDLDRSRQGLIRVSEKSMVDLRQQLDRAKP